MAELSSEGVVVVAAAESEAAPSVKGPRKKLTAGAKAVTGGPTRSKEEMLWAQGYARVAGIPCSLLPVRYSYEYHVTQSTLFELPYNLVIRV